MSFFIVVSLLFVESFYIGMGNLDRIRRFFWVEEVDEFGEVKKLFVYKGIVL